MMVTYKTPQEEFWAGEFLDKRPNVQLIDYGFFYHRDNNFKIDDTYF